MLDKIPVVSVVVITYNSSAYVLETLESIKAQTYQHIELIVSDDGSKDETVAVCEKWLLENKNRFVDAKVITTPKNTGTPSNCNRGINESAGTWVKIIAGDDVLCIDYIELCLEYISNSKNTMEFIWTNIQRYNDTFEKGSALPIESFSQYKLNSVEVTPKEQFEILLRFNPIKAISFFARRDSLFKVGLYNERYPLFEDWPMWLNITQKGYKIYYLDFIGVKYRIHSGSIQQKKIRKNQLINTFHLEKSKMILNEYLLYYPLQERMLIKYLNSFNLFFEYIKLNRNNKLSYFLYHLFTYFPRTLLRSMQRKYEN